MPLLNTDIIEGGAERLPVSHHQSPVQKDSKEKQVQHQGGKQERRVIEIPLKSVS
jgi:hypothetical protein